MLWVESAGLLALAVTALITSRHTQGWTSDTPRSQVAASEVAVYVLMAAGVAAVGWATLARRGRMWTPATLIQAFAVIAAWPMVKSDQSGYQAAGVTTVLTAVVGLVAAGFWARREGTAHNTGPAR